MLEIKNANWLTLSEDLPEYGKFDAVLCIGNSLICLLDPSQNFDLYRRCFENFKSMLKPGGFSWLIIGTWMSSWTTVALSTSTYTLRYSLVYFRLKGPGYKHMIMIMIIMILIIIIIILSFCIMLISVTPGT